jgi:hypothetical protein
VPRFLGPDWIAAFGEALALVDLPAPAADAGLSVGDGDVATVLIVGDVRGDMVAVTVRLSGRRLMLVSGNDPDAAVTLRVGGADAVAFLGGGWEPAPALAAGWCQVRGDLSVLAATRAALAAVQPQLVDLRADTEF